MLTCPLADCAVLPHGGEWAVDGSCPQDPRLSSGAPHPCCSGFLPARATQQGTGSVPSLRKLWGKRGRKGPSCHAELGRAGGRWHPCSSWEPVESKTSIKPGPWAAAGPPSVAGDTRLLAVCLPDIPSVCPAAVECRHRGLPVLVPVPCLSTWDKGAAWTSWPWCHRAMPGARAPAACPRCLQQPRDCFLVVKCGSPKLGLGVGVPGAGEV